MSKCQIHAGVNTQPGGRGKTDYLLHTMDLVGGEEQGKCWLVSAKSDTFITYKHRCNLTFVIILLRIHALYLYVFPGLETGKDIYAFIAKGPNMAELMKKSSIKGLSKSTRAKRSRSESTGNLTITGTIE